MSGRILPFFLGLALLFAGGCARSNDGTVIIPKPLDARRFFDKEPPRMVQPQIESSVFPVAPQGPEVRQARRMGAPPRKRQLHNLPTSSDPEKPLVCKNVSQPGQRYRMVCE